MEWLQALQRAEVLIEQHRYQEAEKQLKQVVASGQLSAHVFSMLVNVCLELDKLQEAKDYLEQAFSIDPNSPYLHYLRSRVHLVEHHNLAAIESAREAVSLAPEVPDYMAYLSMLLLSERRYEEALQMANNALMLDAEHVLALNSRSRALTKLKRKDAASETMDYALKRDPENAFTHTNSGWNALENKQPKKAMYHFKEALRRDPNSEYAQSGMIEAIKSKNWLYRQFFSYSLWMATKSVQGRWVVVLAVYIGYRLMQAAAERFPILLPISIAIAVFIVSTWFITPVSNLLLRLHPFGKHLLSREDKLSSTMVGILFLMLFAAVVLFTINPQPIWMGLGIYALGLTIPASNFFQKSSIPFAFPILFGALALFGLAALQQVYQKDSLSVPLGTYFVIGAVGYTWIANLLVKKT